MRLRRQVGGGPHSEPRKSREPSAHLQLAAALLVHWSLLILYSLLATLPVMSALMLRLRVLLPRVKARLNFSL